jgi:prevent-host-death family protein
MAITTFSSREFNQDTSRAKKAADKGPVFITDRGRPAHVLLTIDEYRKLSSKPSAKHRTLLDALAMDEEDDFEFEIPKFDEHPAPPDLD